jgi:hypothetical protein
MRASIWLSSIGPLLVLGVEAAVTRSPAALAISQCLPGRS